ncbi:MAG TPA: transglutaminase family protein [Tepidisphaeraceae bacterium]|nr:transglutaminase family protein [Tepidisphaeraceae bacterium]
MNLMLYTHPSRQADLLQRDVVYVEAQDGQSIPVKTFFDVYGNKVGRIVAPGGQVRIWSSNTVRDSGLPDQIPQTAAEQHQASPADLPAEVLQYLMCSRYCELEFLQDRAWNLFGHLAPGWARAKAVVDWVHQHMTFGYQYARHTRTAVEAMSEARGVCRDFQHLCVALHRCLNLPARYVTGYLGDIGVPYNPAPMDFSAWHEVYLGGRWWSMDGRHHQPRIGRILMATGRDAADVALTTQFGSGWLTRFNVVTEEARPDSLAHDLHAA